MTAYVYVDGFNLYYCAVRQSDKWLDISRLCGILFPNVIVTKIRYFSARVKALPHDPSAPTRQDVYWRALRTIDSLEIIEGHFVAWPRLLPQFPFAYLPGRNGPQKVQIHKAEEKGSDVNLAAYLVYDNCHMLADESIVISNDSDLARATGLVTGHLERRVTVVNPNRTSNVRRDPKACSISADLKRVATRYLASVNDVHLRNAQFPPILTDAAGTFSKPANW